ncbi:MULTISPECIES: hypothetical protein [Bacillus]|uniref:hypothetical protein n=1 Tax=Bacillus TaxID=1386 RepID=UPI0008566533|nr:MULTISPECIES: hypothetical protein [Bacillus cereus group]MBJ8109513.1 hypothetical protein [Bacillus cereus group sp. N6]MCU5329955.1 hypothetical protein [Bacillus wiedmannii]SCL95179.1 Uncharacterized protein BCRIVMBC120_02652 [Bacillus wiedmannii]
MAIQEQVQLTYEQYLIEKNREKAIRTSSPDDDTDYEKINWYNDMKTSFANKELDDGVKEIRNTSKWYGNVMLQQKENGTYYVYYLGRTLLLKEKVLKRANIFIIHSAIIEMEQEKFMKDLTHIGRWKK